ncbi:hypothetical protein ISCGN_004598 [Ixodes scapularis]
MCTQIIRTRLQKWAEETEVLGELQNGFRTGRCIEDNLFVVTQCIEVAVQEGRPLYAAFLDISKAYDTVDRNILWSRLRGLGINEADVNLLQALYAGVSVRIEWEGHMTRRLPVPRGLRQGYSPASPLLDWGGIMKVAVAAPPTKPPPPLPPQPPRVVVRVKTTKGRTDWRSCTCCS